MNEYYGLLNIVLLGAGLGYLIDKAGGALVTGTVFNTTHDYMEIFKRWKKKLKN